MYCENCSEPIEMQSVVRQQNRVLRSIVRTLRRNSIVSHKAADEIFSALCETDPGAKEAMRRLWEEGGFQPPCGPEDYEEIVDVAIRALRSYRDGNSDSAKAYPCATAALRQMEYENCGISKAPSGWFCKRSLGHSGPCAAIPFLPQ